MIEERKLTVKFSSGFIVSQGCLLWSAEQSEMVKFPFVRYAHYPFIPKWIYAFVSGLVVYLRFSIAAILKRTAYHKIFSAIIKGVSVGVINETVNAENKPMHLNYAATSRPSCCIEIVPTRIFVSKPIPLIQPLEISGINDGVLISRQWNKAVRFVSRLNNCVFLHAVFHRSSRQGSLNFSRILSQGCF